MERTESATVLVVAPRAGEREGYRRWISGIGVEVRGCPGPSAADGCSGLREGTCRLVKGAGVVVLDQRVGHERELEAFYLLHGKRLVLLGPKPEQLLPFGRESMLRIPWPPKRLSLLKAVSYQLAAQGGPGATSPATGG